MLLHLISSLLHTRSLIISYVHVSIKSICCTYLSLFELGAVLLISSVKVLCFSLLNLSVFKINLFMNFY